MERLCIENDTEQQLDIHKVIEYYDNEYADQYDIVFFSNDHSSPEMTEDALQFYNQQCAGPQHRLHRFGYREYWWGEKNLIHRLDAVAVLKTLAKYGNHHIGRLSSRTRWGAVLIQRDHRPYLCFSDYDGKQTPILQSEYYFHELVREHMETSDNMSKGDYETINAKWKQLDYYEIYIPWHKDALW